MKAPLIDRRNSEQIVRQVENSLADIGWHGKEGGAGWAMVRLFARLSELVINRLNQVPEKHFLAFLNEAGVKLLPPRPASVELTFTPAKDAPSSILIPAGTQAATIQTETRPEVIFETARDITVVPNKLVQYITFDELHYSNRTDHANGLKSGSFSVFTGEDQRLRTLYLGDDTLFSFSDDISRQAATISLHFIFSRPGDPEHDGWELSWLYWNGTEWTGMTDAGAKVKDETLNFSRDGEITITNIPEISCCEVGGKESFWIACRLTGGSLRQRLPEISSVSGTCTVEISEEYPVEPDATLSAIHAGTALVPVDPSGEFFPLGQRPSTLDALYVRCDKAFSKSGAKISIKIDIKGLDEDVSSSELDKLAIKWEYSGSNGWVSLGKSTKSTVTPAPGTDFEDTTMAFTRTTPAGKINFVAPRDFAKITVNGQEGYWIRARVDSGSYDIPGGMQPVSAEIAPTCVWVEPKTYPPLIRKLSVNITGYSSTGESHTIVNCKGEVDGRIVDFSSEPAGGPPFSPFRAAEEGPAMYLGFEQVFPADKWIQILFDVQEKSKSVDRQNPRILWEYWNGNRWHSLRISDGTRELTQRGYVGFFAPEDAALSTEFGQNALWIRVRPHLRPVADGGGDRQVPSVEGAATISLNASSSRSFDSQGRISKYIWRQVLCADAGNDQEITTNEDRVTITLDASGSTPRDRIAQYIWRNVKEEDQSVPQKQTAAFTPYLKVIRINTVPALNAVTIRDEILGSSDGKADQVFQLIHKPVLPDLQIAVREPDRPSDYELETLRKELGKADRSSSPIITVKDTDSETGVWVLWHQVADFYSSDASSRHFSLDPIDGRIVFGDGRRGKVPPAGHDNIMAVVYRTHHGGDGNTEAGTISVLRNPAGDLAQIKSVTNHEKASGGSDAETVEEVKQRGPQTLKHRQRAVTVEDYQWLAREASGEVGNARCLPTRDSRGLTRAGWVTVVITPKSNDARPEPGPALLRYVEKYLKDRCIINLKDVDHINVKGPEYLEVTVLARVVPVEPEKSDEVELNVLQRLETFLHPLRGGPERRGWELGRDVFLSEVFAEIEAVSGVDHVDTIRLQCSQQQYALRIAEEEGKYRKIPYDIPAGSKVSTFDERIMLILTGPVSARDTYLKEITVYGLKAGDRIRIVSDQNRVLKDNLTVGRLDNGLINFEESFTLANDLELLADALMTEDQRIRLPLADSGMIKQGDRITGVHVRLFEAGDKVSVVAGTRRDPELEFLPIEQVSTCEDRIYVPEGHLIYSGSHDIKMILE